MEQILDVGSVVEAVSADVIDASHFNIDLEGLCMHCGAEDANTKFFRTSIPHFREIMLSVFYCDNCGDRNDGVMFVGELPPRGCCYTLRSSSVNPKMLNRQVVKSESATIKIPELDFEIQPKARHGSLSTVEGILMRAVDDLQTLQEERKKVAPETAEAIDQFLVKLRACASGESSFTFIVDDPAGNSFIENPFAPSSDPSLTIKFYDRTPEQQEWLRYQLDSTQTGRTPNETLSGVEDGVSDQVKREPHGSVGAAACQRAIAQSHSTEIADALFQYTSPEEVYIFPASCYDGCASGCETRMFRINIPYFKEVILMATTCDSCGYRSSEVHASGTYSDKAKKLTLHVKNVNDLSRDVIKSDTASVEIPELDLVLGRRTLGGLVTTVEGLISKISENYTKTNGIDESKYVYGGNPWRGGYGRPRKAYCLHGCCGLYHGSCIRCCHGREHPKANIDDEVRRN